MMRAATPVDAAGTAKAPPVPPEQKLVWTPEDVVAVCGITVREAFKWMRQAGARAAGRNGKSLRISREKLYRWLDNDKRSSRDS
jgi:hypothetical protein